MIFAVFGALTLAAIIALLAPMVHDGGVPDDGVADDLAVFRDQLMEVDRDLARGTLSNGEAESARLEIHRRMLSAQSRTHTPSSATGLGLRAAVTAGVAMIVPCVALGTYLALGSPSLKNLPTSAGMAAGYEAQQFNEMIGQLAARLAETPDDIKGWALLGRSYRQAEKFDQAKKAFRRVLGLAPGGADSFSDFGEMATAAADGDVTAEALEAFLAALGRDRDDPRARFYVGMSYAQRNDPRSAIAIWRDLTAGAPEDAGWTATVRQKMFQVAQDSQIMPMNVEPRHPLDFGPTDSVSESPVEHAAAVADATHAVPPSDPDDITSPDVGALKGRFSGENLQGIQAMVGSLAGRLENNPEDYAGWLMLGRSHIVLKNTEGAKRAFAKAMALKPDELTPKAQMIALLWGETPVDAAPELPGELMAAARDALRVDPNNPEGLLVEGLAAAKAGDADTAKRKWRQAEAATPKDGALAGEIARRLVSLP